MVPPSIQDIIDVMNRKNYHVFTSSRGFDLNIIGIRSKETKAGLFDDFITVSYFNSPSWSYFVFPATTDPGTYYLDNPLNVEGTAILVPGQYRSSWTIGKHRNKYKALVQNKSVSVYRDGTRDAVLDTEGVPIKSGRFGINIHRASTRHNVDNVGKFSAGCQVIQDPDHFVFFMRLVEKSATIYGSNFTYTLLEEKEFG